MCKRCSELEQEIEAAEEYGFGFTSYQLREELEALQASHLPKKARTRRGGWTCPVCGFENNPDRTVCLGCSLGYSKPRR